MGLETVDPDLKLNLGVCLGMARIKDGEEEARNDTLSKNSPIKLDLSAIK